MVQSPQRQSPVRTKAQSSHPKTQSEAQNGLETIENGAMAQMCIHMKADCCPCFFNGTHEQLLMAEVYPIKVTNGHDRVGTSSWKVPASSYQKRHTVKPMREAGFNVQLSAVCIHLLDRWSSKVVPLKDVGTTFLQGCGFCFGFDTLGHNHGLSGFCKSAQQLNQSPFARVESTSRMIDMSILMYLGLRSARTDREPVSSAKIVHGDQEPHLW